MTKLKESNATKIKEFICMSDNQGFTSVKDLINKRKEEQKTNKEYVEAKIDENKMNILLFTSGTTSKSKAVMLSHKNIASNIYALQSCEDIRPTDVNIAFYHFITYLDQHV